MTRASSESATAVEGTGKAKGTLVHVVRDPGVSGSARIALDVLSNPELAGFRRIIICGSGSGEYGPFVQETDRLGIEWVQVEHLCREFGSHDMRAFTEMSRTFRRLKPDLVHTHSAKPFLLAGLAAWVARVPHRVHTLHGISFHKFTPLISRALYYLMEQFASLFYQCIVSVNRHYLQFFPLARVRRAIQVIANGIDLPASPPPETAAPPGEFRILFAGRLDDQKDPFFLLTVAEQIDRHWTAAVPPRFYLAGSGPLAARISAEIAARGLTERVIPLGWVTNLADHYRTSKVLFLPSKWEACGLVLIEAAAHGCPAVASAVEGVPEFLRHDHNGLLFDQGDVDAACRCLARLGSDEALRRELARQARADALLRGKNLMIDRYNDLYRRLGIAL